MMGTYGLLGEKLGHSFSPQIHAKLADYEYRLFEKQPQELEAFLKSDEFDGINVTIPYKKDVIPYCSELSDAARSIGSVNTLVRRPDGTLYGDNTDYFGFAYMVKKSGVSVSGKKCVVFGAGGASVTVIAVLRDMGAGQIVNVSRRGKDNYTNLSSHYDAEILVNATPVGMYPNTGASVASLAPFKNAKAAFDLVYNPARTEFLLQAEEIGAAAVNGLSMLVAQAKRACEIFQGTEISDGVIEDITAEIARSTKNIALIGMPGCGKTSIGRALAEKTGRQFIDIDEMIEKAAQKSIPEIFVDDGEEKFRLIETGVLEEFSKRSGLVIATGGGVVTKPRNLPLLRQNSTIIWLQRPTQDLPSDGRPLSQKHSAQVLYEQRLPLYTAWSEYTFKCVGVNETAENIKKELQL